LRDPERGGGPRTRDHTELLATELELGTLWDEYGLVGDIVVNILFFYALASALVCLFRMSTHALCTASYYVVTYGSHCKHFGMLRHPSMNSLPVQDTFLPPSPQRFIFAGKQFEDDLYLLIYLLILFILMLVANTNFPAIYEWFS
jgi:hypothetical protein